MWGELRSLRSAVVGVEKRRLESALLYITYREGPNICTQGVFPTSVREPEVTLAVTAFCYFSGGAAAKIRAVRLLISIEQS